MLESYVGSRINTRVYEGNVQEADELAKSEKGGLMSEFFFLKLVYVAFEENDACQE